MHSEALTSFYSPTLHTITGSQSTPVTPYLATKMLAMTVETDFIPELSETIQSLPEIVRHAKSRQGDFRRADRHRKVCADPAFDTVETQKKSLSVADVPRPPPSVLQLKSCAVADALLPPPASVVGSPGPPPPPASVLSSPGPPPSRLQSFSDAVSDSLPPPSALVSNEFRAIRHKMRGHPKPGVGAISHTATFPKLQAGKDLLLSKPREPYPVELCETSKMWTVDNSLSEDKDCGLVEMDHWQPSVVPASVPPSGFSFGGGRVGSQSSQHHGSWFGDTANACYIPGLFEASSAGSLFGPTLPYLGSSGRSMGLSFEAPLTGGHLNSPLPTTHGFNLTHPLGASLGSSLFGSSLRTLQQHHVLPQAQKPLDIKKNIQKLVGDSERYVSASIRP